MSCVKLINNTIGNGKVNNSNGEYNTNIVFSRKHHQKWLIKLLILNTNFILILVYEDVIQY